MMEAPETQLESLHQVYNALTRQTLRFKPFERLWADFVRAGYGEADLRLTVQYIEAQNRKADFKISLRLDRLLDDMARFESYRGEADLAERARAARARAHQPTAGEKARAEMCGHAPVPPAKEPTMARDAVLSGLDKLKNDLSRSADFQSAVSQTSSLPTPPKS